MEVKDGDGDVGGKEEGDRRVQQGEGGGVVPVERVVRPELDQVEEGEGGPEPEHPGRLGEYANDQEEVHEDH